MAIEHVLAAVPVANFDVAHAWYERLFGRPAGRHFQKRKTRRLIAPPELVLQIV